MAEDAGTLPPGILALEVKFLCRECGTKLIIDARLQGRAVNCPKCGAPIEVPHCAGILPPPGETRKDDASTDRAPVFTRLTDAEIEFLSGPDDLAPGLDLAR